MGFEGTRDDVPRIDDFFACVQLDSPTQFWRSYPRDAYRVVHTPFPAHRANGLFFTETPLILGPLSFVSFT